MSADETMNPASRDDMPGHETKVVLTGPPREAPRTWTIRERLSDNSLWIDDVGGGRRWIKPDEPLYFAVRDLVRQREWAEANLAQHPPHHFEQVAKFREMIGYESPGRLNKGLQYVNPQDLAGIRTMLKEEYREVFAAMQAAKSGDEMADIDFIDGLADLIVVCLGAFHLVGANADVVLDLVTRSNLTKTPGDNGRGIAKDAVKGPSYQPPNLLNVAHDVLWSKPGDVVWDERGQPGLKVGPPEGELRGLDRLEGTVSRSMGLPFIKVDVKPPRVELPRDYLGLQPPKPWPDPPGPQETRAAGSPLPYPFVEAARIRETKTHDYQGGGVTSSDYNPFGLQSYVHNINHKSQRLISLARLALDGKEPNHESLRDNAVDLLNYVAFLIEFIDGVRK